MNAQRRVAIKCYQCGLDFSLLREFDGKPSFLIPCPFCGRANVVDLAPYRSARRKMMAGEESEPLTLEVLELPDVLPGRAPRPGEEGEA